MTPALQNLDLLDQLESLFETHGHKPYEGKRSEAISALQHALQCAQLAEWADASPSLVAAAFLHDVGHFLSADPDDVDDVHELRALGLLASDFGSEVLEPIRLHVQAKRYLVAVDASYLASLSAASLHSLNLQGGPLSEPECQAFEALPFAESAISLRRWDDAAKEPGKQTPPLAYYLSVLDIVRQQSFSDSRISID